MSKLPILSSDKIIRALRRAGFTFAPKRGKGSHTAMVGIDAQGRTRLVIVPKRKDVPVGTLTAIIQEAGLERESFLALL